MWLRAVKPKRKVFWNPHLHCNLHKNKNILLLWHVNAESWTRNLQSYTGFDEGRLGFQPLLQPSRFPYRSASRPSTFCDQPCMGSHVSSITLSLYPKRLYMFTSDCSLCNALPSFEAVNAAPRPLHSPSECRDLWIESNQLGSAINHGSVHCEYISVL
jgi:hypothetical protein